MTFTDLLYDLWIICVVGGIVGVIGYRLERRKVAQSDRIDSPSEAGLR